MGRAISVALVFSLAATVAYAQEPSTPNAEYGKIISIIGGCHDCHTADYSENLGILVNPETALKGNAIGYQGPWGTTYAANLRLIAAKMSEDEWATFIKGFSAQPPMPYYNLAAMDDVQLRSLYEYIRSLGDPGEPAPSYVPPGVKPTTPFVVLAPPTMP
jgi:mono/diheme cytochrome c family protein